MRMLSSLTLAFAAILVPTPLLPADDRADALAVVDDAIKAHGGVEALAKAQGFTRKAVGTVIPFGKELAVEEELTVNLPEKMRFSLEIGKATKILIVLNGDKGWESNNGAPASDVGAARLKEVSEEAYVDWLMTLMPLKKDGFSLKLLPAKNVNNKPAVGVAVAAKGRPDAKLYFDKESHLLVKIEREAEQAGKKVDKEYVYGDYKAVDGAKLPGKVTEFLNGNKFSEITVSSYKLQKPDDAAFSKP